MWTGRAPIWAPCHSTNASLVHCLSRSVRSNALYAQGLIPHAWYQADSAYAATHIDAATNASYRTWAEPLTRLMQHSHTFTHLVRPFGAAWAQHMAYVMGQAEQDSFLGRLLNTLGVPLNRWLGRVRQ